ncbi:hypothetical protein [Lysinibacillus xylanilyticus]|uniref:hypothetical protein n=1 Tax=Lysinibacillus xylanilyticus TaxID=582475 RepID=UPI0036DD4877
MLVLVNSSVHQAGVSTMAQSIAFTYSNWINRPVLMVSIKSDRFYKTKATVKPDFNSKFLSIVNGNTGGHGDLKVYTYKINELLYYYQAHSSPASSQEQHEDDLFIFLERASREFGMVIVDLDDGINSFKKFLDIADVCFTVLPPDKMVIEDAAESIGLVLENYKEHGGLAVKTKMKYIANKREPSMTLTNFAKLLGVSQQDVFTVPYDNRFIKEGNANKLLHFLGETLLYKRTQHDKILEINFKRIYDMLRKG